MGTANPAVGEEVCERVPPAQHVVDGLGEVVVARDPGELCVQPVVELGHQRRAEFLADDEALSRALAVDAALDHEQGIELLLGLERNRIPYFPSG